MLLVWLPSFTGPVILAAKISSFPFPEYNVRSGLNLLGLPKTPPVQKLSMEVVPAKLPPLVDRRGLKVKAELPFGLMEPGQVNKQYCSSDVSGPFPKEFGSPPTYTNSSGKF